MQKFFSPDARLRLLQLSIILIPFSYQPRILFSSLQGLSMEVSFVQIAAGIFILSSVKSVFSNLNKLAQMLPIKLLTVFVALNWLSIFWTASITRTVVLATYWSFLLVLVVSCVSLFIDRKISQKDITNPLIIGTLVGLTFGTWQYLGVMFGLDSSATLIRHAYNAELFGFPRIQAFALEPQFYASTLLAPILYLSWRVLFTKHSNYHNWILGWSFAVFLLTVSRGSLGGFVVAIIILLAAFALSEKIKQKSKAILSYSLILLASLAATVGLVYFSGQLQGGTHNGARSVETFFDHISHGIIDIQIATGEDGEEIDGLVEASTSGRFYMVERALELLSNEPTRYIYGIGAGSFGPVFQAEHDGVDLSNHVINNQYVEFFTELGVIGLILFVAFVATFCQLVWSNTNEYRFLMLAIFASFLVQYLFFSLQTNVTNIWLFVGVAMGVAAISKKGKKATTNARTK